MNTCRSVGWAMPITIREHNVSLGGHCPPYYYRISQLRQIKRLAIKTLVLAIRGWNCVHIPLLPDQILVGAVV